MSSLKGIPSPKLIKDSGALHPINHMKDSIMNLLISFGFEIVGIYVDENVSFAQLKDLIYKIIYSLFGEEIELRFRPSYFPFTEPSAEVDILSKEGKWLEILGCGLVNPIVLENCNIDSCKYSGLAFGLGIERIAMLKHGVTDIREFYKSNLDFLRQFK